MQSISPNSAPLISAALTRAPLIIGGTGGSGTRAIAQLLIQSGRVYLGNNHNRALDCLDFKSLYDEHIPSFLSYFYRGQKITAKQLTDQTSLTADFADCLRNYQHNYQQHQLQRADDSTPPIWGWKGPRSMFLLPFFHSCFPDLKFLHVVRDGRDMAYSTNQNQLNLYGELSLSAEEQARTQAEKSIALWGQANLSASAYANTHMPTQYHCVRYEDLILQTDTTIANMATFLDLDADDLLQQKNNIAASPNCGRWKAKNQQEIDAVINKGSRGLQHFGYL